MLCSRNRVRAAGRRSGVGGRALPRSALAVVLCTPEPASLISTYEAAGVSALVIGEAGGDRLVVPGLVDLGVAELSDARQRKLTATAATA